MKHTHVGNLIAGLGLVVFAATEKWGRKMGTDPVFLSPQLLMKNVTTGTKKGVCPQFYLPWLAAPVLGAVLLLGRTDQVTDSNTIGALNDGLQATHASHHDNSFHPAANAANGFPGRPTSTAAAAHNLWERLRAGFALPAADNAAVQGQLDRMTRDTGNIARILSRGEPYLHHILQETLQRGLPAELALLPVIESAFDPHARSPRNAAGLWQFMPATARELGLRQDRWYDGRRDVIAATAAALDYLASLQRRFDGDWLLALAAYNAGPGRVQQAIRHNRERGVPIDFWHLSLPGETRDYVPKLLALRKLMDAPDAWGLDLPRLRNTPYFAPVEVDGPLDLGVAARLAGVSLDEIQRLNPAYTRQAIRRSGPRTLLIPHAAAPAFRTQLTRLTEDERVQWVRHRIVHGDTLSTIARHYGIPTARLRAFNRLPDANIMAGDLLVIPVSRG